MEGYLLRKQDIQALCGEHKTHFLNDSAKRENLSLGDLTGLTGFGFHLISVAPGDYTTEYHVHHDEDECLYILSGTALARIGNHSSQVNAGDFIGYRAGGEAHSLLNNGDEPLVCIVVGQRLPHDVVDYPDKQKRLYRQPDRDWDLVDRAAIEHPRRRKESK